MDARQRGFAVSYVKDILCAEMEAGMHKDIASVDNRFVKLCEKIETYIDAGGVADLDVLPDELDF